MAAHRRIHCWHDRVLSQGRLALRAGSGITVHGASNNEKSRFLSKDIAVSPLGVTLVAFLFFFCVCVSVSERAWGS